MKYRKLPVVIEATQWFKNGDHPEDRWTAEGVIHTDEGEVEGRVVRYYRHPKKYNGDPCQYCGVRMGNHGWIDTLEAGHNVCPGDWIITGVKGEFYPCKDEIFRLTYEPVDADGI